jgi:hypothetical protein
LTACAIGEAWLEGTDAVAAHDWSGAYVGLPYGTTTRAVQFSPGSFFELDDRSVAGAHACYLSRDLSGKANTKGGLNEADKTVNTLSLRVGLSF